MRSWRGWRRERNKCGLSPARLTLAELAAMVGGRAAGDVDKPISGVTSLTQAGPSDLGAPGRLPLFSQRGRKRCRGHPRLLQIGGRIGSRPKPGRDGGPSHGAPDHPRTLLFGSGPTARTPRNSGHRRGRGTRYGRVGGTLRGDRRKRRDRGGDHPICPCGRPQRSRIGPGT